MAAESGYVEESRARRVVADDRQPVGSERALSDPMPDDARLAEVRLVACELLEQILQHGGIVPVVPGSAGVSSHAHSSRPPDSGAGRR